MRGITASRLEVGNFVGYVRSRSCMSAGSVIVKLLSRFLNWRFLPRAQRAQENLHQLRLPEKRASTHGQVAQLATEPQLGRAQERAAGNVRLVPGRTRHRNGEPDSLQSIPPPYNFPRSKSDEANGRCLVLGVLQFRVN